MAETFNHSESTQSTAAREIIGYTRAICIASQQFASQLHNTAILLCGDSQAALEALRKFASPIPIIHQELKKLFEVCASINFDVIRRWISREDLQAADELSRRPDASDWGCTRELVDIVLKHFQTTIELDVFASDIHHVADRFVSAFYVPGCAAVQAIYQDWQALLPHPSDTVWAFPSTKAISTTLSIIERQRANAIIIMPTRTASNEWIQVHNLSGNVSEPFPLPRRAELCCPSLRVPAEAINPILMGLSAFHVH